MKVLFIHNIAGVSSNLLKGLKRLDYESLILVNRKDLREFPNEVYVSLHPVRFFMKCFFEVRHYDIIHISGLIFHSQLIKLISYCKLRNKKVIIHLHGSDIRENRVLANKIINKGVKVIISTPDLFNFIDENNRAKVSYLPNPIDDMFNDYGRSRNKKILYFFKKYEDARLIRSWGFDKGLNIDIKKPELSYNEMPFILNDYESYFDNFTFDVFSKTGLEALACGCKVYLNYELVNNYQKVLANHKLDKVVNELDGIYKEL